MEEIQRLYNETVFAKNAEIYKQLKDVTKNSAKSIQTINKDTLRSYFTNLTSNQKNLRNVSRYLYYRSNIYFRLVNWYADMWDLRARHLKPNYDLVKGGDESKILKSLNESLDVLDTLNLHGNMTEALITSYVEDVYYSIVYYEEDVGTFFFRLDADECAIDGRYQTGDLSFSVDMSAWRSTQRQQIIEWLGSPLKEMYQAYQTTGEKWQHCPDDWAFMIKFRMDDLNTIIPPFAPLFLQLVANEDNIDQQAVADALSIFKLIYMPLEVMGKQVDDFKLSADLAKKYFDRLVNDALPDYTAAAMVPGDELKVIDFNNSADNDINRVEASIKNILATAGGGAVLNTSNITSTAAFNAWLREETEFAISTILPQIDGFANRWLILHCSNPVTVKHFECSVYTKDTLYDQLLQSCQYSYSNRLALNTLLGISEKETIAMNFLENEVLKLPEIMRYPLQSSFTTSNDGSVDEDGYTTETGQGRPSVDDDELSESGERSRNR
jgi:hypothetical protein